MRQDIFTRALDDHLGTVEGLRIQLPALNVIASRMERAIMTGKQILWCGNGGSAADSQHLAAELVGRFRHEREPLPSLALTVDSSALTAIANDYGYENVFSRQVRALCKSGDVVVGLSTSGSSLNVVRALETARELGAFTVALTGKTGGELNGLADAIIRVPTEDAARVQEAHILCGHMLCEWIELAWCESRADVSSRRD